MATAPNELAVTELICSCMCRDPKDPHNPRKVALIVRRKVICRSYGCALFGVSKGKVTKCGQFVANGSNTTVHGNVGKVYATKLDLKKKCVAF